MSKFTPLFTHLTALVEADEELRGYLADKWLYLGLPETYNSITVDGIIALDDKQDSHTAFINLFADKANEVSPIEFYDMADRLKTVLASSPAIVTDGWLARPEPANGLDRALFPCTLYLANIPE